MHASFFCPGIPVPKGSARAFYNKGMRFPVVIQTNAKQQKPWASLISMAGKEHIEHPSTLPIRITLTFNMPRPKGHFSPATGLRRKAAPLCPTKKPDLDKLVRCALDALTGVAFMDDSQVVFVQAEKEFNAVPGVRISVSDEAMRLQEVS